MVHLSRSKRPEITLFGKDHQLTNDFIFVQNGLTIRADGKGNLLLIRYLPDQQEDRRVCSTNLSDAIRQLAALNCSYTEMVELLQEAKRNNQLTSRLAINAVPRLNQNRFEPDEFEVAEDKDSDGFFPSLFGSRKEESPTTPAEKSPTAEELRLEPATSGEENRHSDEERLPAPAGDK